MHTRTSWEILHEAIWKMQHRKKSKNLTIDDFNRCLSMTPGLQFSERSTMEDLLSELVIQGIIRINKKTIKVIKPYS